MLKFKTVTLAASAMVGAFALSCTHTQAQQPYLYYEQYTIYEGPAYQPPPRYYRPYRRAYPKRWRRVRRGPPPGAYYAPPPPDYTGYTVYREQPPYTPEPDKWRAVRIIPGNEGTDTPPPRSVPVPRARPMPDDNTASASPDPVSGPVSCAQAGQILKDFGFSGIQPVNCQGNEYGFKATRDGKPFDVRLSALNGELIEIKRN